MLKVLKNIYNKIVELKKYHAVHVCIVPLFIIVLAVVLLVCAVSSADIDPELGRACGIFLVMCFATIYFTAIIFAVLAILIELIILLVQYHKKIKITVKSKFLLCNPIYNIIFILSLVNFVVITIFILKTLIHC